MITRRTKRILELSKHDYNVMNTLNVPKYESTKGTTDYERNILLNRTNLLLESNVTNSFEEEAINIFSQEEKESIQNKDFSLSSLVSVNEKTKISQCNVLEPAKDLDQDEQYLDNTNKDSFTDLEPDTTPTDPFVSSGSEYYPSSDEPNNKNFVPVYPDKEVSKKSNRECTINNKKECTDTQNINDQQNISSRDTVEVNILSDKIKNETNETKKVKIQKTKRQPRLNNLSNDSSDTEQAIEISQVKKKVTGHRIRDKVHCCLFCFKIRKQMAKHLEIIHPNELEVAKILAYQKNSAERKKGFTQLLRVGDYYHNCEILTKRQGELILVRRPNPKEFSRVTYNDYGPCPECLGFMLKKHLWHHIKYGCQKYCPNNQAQGKLRRNFISESTILISHTFGEKLPSDYCNTILANLKTDIISLVCKQDNLIIKFGNMLYDKYHNTQSELIRQSMRQLGRLLLVLRRMDPTKNSLFEWLQPENFDIIIGAVRQLSIFSTDISERPKFSVPSLALKLGYNLKKCVTILRGIALRKTDLKLDEQLKSFLHLMELEWNVKISSNALATLYDRKLNAVELLPLTDDLVKLNNFLNLKIKDAKEAIKICCDYKNFTNLATLTLAKIILFNKRRSGEASKMTLLQYASRPDWSQVGTDEFKQSLSPLEIELSSKLTLVQIRGKRGKTVNVLLTSDLKENIDLLVTSRSTVGILDTNPYIFARSFGSVNNLRGHDCLRKISIDANLSRPELISGTKLRKYIATVSQIFNLTENETDWLARHLGHDIRVHREFYRLQESSVELAKISRILLAVENGEAHKFKGKTLSEINITELPELEQDDEVVTSDEETEINENVKEIQIVPPKEVQNNRGDGANETKKTKKYFGHSSVKPIVNKRNWSSEESGAVISFFRSEIQRSTIPGKLKCLECSEKNPILNRRNWKEIKYHVYNYIKKINKNK